jgi:GDPmannose 4,6-dehydratase
MPTALITGITGQDGSYLAELLLEKGYRVVGLIRPGGAARSGRIEHLRDRLEILEADLLDQDALQAVIRRERPDEIYNLAARASSNHLFAEPVLTAEYNGVAVLRLLEAIRTTDPQIRFCQASSSEMFGKSRETPQSEATAFYPRNPYGVAKLYGHWISVNYRETHGIFACSSILFNHESPRRGEEFVTRKITRAVARIRAGLQDAVQLGNLQARRDWGFAGDYVRAMWQMLQAPVADDYVVATGESHSVGEFCEIAFGHVGLDYGKYVQEDSRSARSGEVVQLVGNPAKARRVLDWRSTLSFQDLVRTMVDADIEALASGALGNLHVSKDR